MRNLLSAFVISFMALSLTACGGDQTLPSDPFEAEKVKEKEKQVRENMRTVQIAAEHFAADHGNINYPVAVDDMFKTYFPGGTEGHQVAPVGLINPFTSVNEFPTLGRMQVKTAEDLRHSTRFPVPRGTIQYLPLDGGHSYAIVGGAHDDQVLMDELNPGQILVFSNL